jgi:hypothetical protein
MQFGTATWLAAVQEPVAARPAVADRVEADEARAVQEFAEGGDEARVF